ncbi:hypothetical protein [Nonomuraea sp. 10N515B]|uniref:hypothetical protein n=1 Tax=Nonomuraea sp. 10N515B TaxID=3457422 RepID=UPI003FCDA7A6
MSEMRRRKVVAESRIAACAVIAAGETFPTLLWQDRAFANAVLRLANLAEQAEDEQLQQLTDELLALFHVVSEALVNHYGPALAAHAERLRISAEEVEERLYPALPPDEADDATRRAYANSIYGATDRLRKAGFTSLGQDRGHVLHDIIRIVWVVAQRRADIDAFLNRLEELRADLDPAVLLSDEADIMT